MVAVHKEGLRKAGTPVDEIENEGQDKEEKKEEIQNQDIEEGEQENIAPQIIAEDKTINIGEEFDPKTDVTATDKDGNDITKNIEILENTAPGKGNEIQLTDALETLIKNEAMYAYDFEGQRYDVGDKLGFLQATVEFAMKREELREPFIEYLNTKPWEK